MIKYFRLLAVLGAIFLSACTHSPQLAKNNELPLDEIKKSLLLDAAGRWQPVRINELTIKEATQSAPGHFKTIYRLSFDQKYISGTLATVTVLAEATLKYQGEALAIESKSPLETKIVLTP